MSHPAQSCNHERANKYCLLSVNKPLSLILLLRADMVEVCWILEGKVVLQGQRAESLERLCCKRELRARELSSGGPATTQVVCSNKSVRASTPSTLNQILSLSSWGA